MPAGLWLCCSASPALASPTLADASASPGSPAAGEDCRDDVPCLELIDSARRLSKSNQLNAALLTYEKAIARRPSPWILISIGRVQQKLGRPAEAILSYRRFLRETASQPSEGSDTAREYLKEAEQDLLALRAREGLRTPEKPLYKKWWFWVAMSGAAVTAGAVATGVVVATRPTAAMERGLPINTFSIVF